MEHSNRRMLGLLLLSAIKAIQSQYHHNFPPPSSSSSSSSSYPYHNQPYPPLPPHHQQAAPYYPPHHQQTHQPRYETFNTNNGPMYFTDDKEFSKFQSEITLQATEDFAVASAIDHLYNDIGYAGLLNLQGASKFLDVTQNYEQYANQNPDITPLDQELNKLATESTKAGYMGQFLAEISPTWLSQDMLDHVYLNQLMLDAKINQMVYDNATPAERKEIEDKVRLSQFKKQEMLLDVLSKTNNEEEEEEVEEEEEEEDVLNRYKEMLPKVIDIYEISGNDQVHHQAKRDYEEALRNYLVNPSPDTALLLQQANLAKEIASAGRAHNIAEIEQMKEASLSLLNVAQNQANYAKQAISHADLLDNPIPMMPDMQENLIAFGLLPEAEPNAVSMDELFKLMILTEN